MSDFTEFDEKPKSGENDKTDEQQFITEKIINKRKKRWLRRFITFLFVIVCAITFGVLARFFFLISGEPLINILGLEVPLTREQVSTLTEKTPTPTPKPTFTPTPKPSVTPKLLPTRIVETQAPDATQIPTPTPETTAVVTMEAAGTPTEKPAASPAATGEVTPEFTPLLVPSVTPAIEDPDKEKDPYERFIDKYMNEVRVAAQSVSGTIVSVAGVITGINYAGDNYESRTYTAGLIMGQDGVDVLILTDYAKLENVSWVEVTFSDNEKVFTGEIYNYDVDMGLAIVGVAISSLDEGMFETMEYGVLCKTEDITNWTPVFELGRTEDYPEALAFGFINTSDNVEPARDSQIKYFTTQWMHMTDAKGFVFNMDGYVLGMEFHPQINNPNEERPSFISLCELKDELDILLNGGKRVQFGIKASALPRIIKERGDISNGIYLNQVIARSPAYNAGLRVGDIIIEINGEAIMGVDRFMDILSNASVSQALNVVYFRNYPDGLKKMTAHVILTTN